MLQMQSSCGFLQGNMRCMSGVIAERLMQDLHCLLTLPRPLSLWSKLDSWVGELS